jgi:[NiFe] hydrogenase diaphorase moiety small subunit
MLFVEGNHICPECEKTGICDLQAYAYRLNMLAPTLPYRYAIRDIDATNSEVFIDRSRCILCGMCDVASRYVDKKTVFAFEDRSGEMRIAVDSQKGLIDTPLRAFDKAAQVCPVGSILIKGTAFQSPYGQRTYDTRPIGADIEVASNNHEVMNIAEQEGND